MKIEKYLTNKDINITNDDIDVSRLIKDLQQGMVSEETLNAKLEEAQKSWQEKSSKDYADLESKYNELEKRNGDLTTSNAQLKLENIMTREGFKEEDFKEISKLRNSLYEDEKDDVKAIQEIKEKYKSTYFQEEEKTPFTPAPNETGVKGNSVGNSEPIEITRKTSLKDLLIKEK